MKLLNKLFKRNKKTNQYQNSSNSLELKQTSLFHNIYHKESLMGRGTHVCDLYTYNDFLDLLYDESLFTVAALQKPDMALHLDLQDQSCEAWHKLLELIEYTHKNKLEIFAPNDSLGWDTWSQITTLPPTISQLKTVKTLNLYGSNLLSIPPEIGEMENLEVFTPYTSYGLHWFPYEITRCKKLKSSTVSTRALYGNYKYRTPFPLLNDPDDLSSLNPQSCSVCNAPLDMNNIKQVWISLVVATDVLPLLINACSQACINRLPAGADNYIAFPHVGGEDIIQPRPQN